MRKIAILMLLLATALSGCNAGIQRGRFGSAGENTLSLASLTGCLSIVSGTALGPDAQPVGPPQKLLYFLILCPGLNASGSGSRAEYATYITTLIYTWEGQSGSVPVSIRWDRQADSVEIGGRGFDREKGNVFVVSREHSGRVITQQLASVGPQADFPELLRHIQEQLPGDTLVASVRAQK